MDEAKGAGIATLVAGSILTYSGIKGYSILKATQNLIQGKSVNTDQSVAAINTATAIGTSGGAPGGSIAPGASSAQQWAKAHLGDYGWGPDQWSSLQSLWNGESGWRWNAQNPTSSAYGIPQSLPGSKMSSAGADWKTNPVTQMRWGMQYIKDTYGDPNNAYSTWLSRSPHWY